MPSFPSIQIAESLEAKFFEEINLSQSQDINAIVEGATKKFADDDDDEEILEHIKRVSILLNRH